MVIKQPKLCMYKFNDLAYQLVLFKIVISEE